MVHDYIAWRADVLSAVGVYPMLAFILMLINGPAYQWRPDIDVSDSFVLSTLFADGAH